MAILKSVKKIIGLSGQDYLIGGTGAEDLFGLAGNDTLQGNVGDDVLSGGTGKDTAVFSGRFADYDFANPAGGLQVTHVRGSRADGSDLVLSDVECLKFADITIDLTLNHAPVVVADNNRADLVKERGGLANASGGDATATGNVLSNDKDIELSLQRQTLSVTNPGAFTGKYGALTLNANGVWTYRLNDNDADTQALRHGQTATDVFTYVVSDGHGGTSTGNVTITIQGANDTPVAQADTNGQDAVVEAGGINNTVAGDASAAGNVLANDRDMDAGDSKTVTTTGLLHGTYGDLTLNANGSWTYVLNNADPDTEALRAGQSVSDVFTYSLSDAVGATSASSLSINITGSNDAPVITSSAAAAAGRVIEAGHLDSGAIAAGAVVATGTLTSSDVDSAATAAWSVAGTGTYGVISITPDGTWKYTLNNSRLATQRLKEGETATETFTATVTDDKGAAATQLITITVKGSNDAPVITSSAAAAAGRVVEAGHLDSGAIAAGVVVATGTLSSSDVDSAATAAWSIAGTGTYGAMSITPSGTWTYILNNSRLATQRLNEGETATETFTATVTDDKDATASQLVTITVTGTNDAPVITSSAAAAAGSVTEAVTFAGGSQAAGQPIASGQLTASDIDAGATQSWSGSAGGTYGSFSINAATGAWTYTLDNARAATQALKDGDVRTETFTATVTDDKGAAATQVVTITINGKNDAPVANDDDLTVSGPVANEDTVLSIDRANLLIANDTDPEHDPLIAYDHALTSALGAQVRSPGTAEFTYDATGVAAIQALAEGESLIDTFSYRTTDGALVSNSATVKVLVQGRNDAVVITSAAQTGSVVEDATSATASDTISFSDIDLSDTHTVSVAAHASNTTALGLFSLAAVSEAADAADGAVQWTYALSAGAAQYLAEGVEITEVYTVTVDDGHGSTKTQDVSITIRGTNDGAAITANAGGDYAVTEAGGVGNAVAGDPSAQGQLTISDADSGQDHFQTPASLAGTYGTFTFNAATGAWTYTLNQALANALAAGANVADALTVTSFDGTATHNITVNITGGNDGAILSGTADPAALIELGNASAQDIDPLTGTFEITDADVGDTLTPSIVGTAAVKLNGGTYTLPAGAAALIANGALTLTGATSTGGGAAIGYSYDPGPANLDFLSAGDTLTITYQVKVNDGTSDSATQDVTFTITGTNDAPVFAAEATGFSAIGSVEQVNTQAVGDQYIPYISNLADDNFLVTWTDVQSGMRKAQILDSNGDKDGVEFRIMTATSGYDSGQLELVDGRIVAYSATGPTFGVILGTDGQPSGVSIDHIGPQSGYSYLKSVALTGGGFAIAASVNGYVEIGVQTYAADGSKAGMLWSVPSGTFNEFVTKDIVSLTDGGFLMLFDQAGGGLKGQRFDAAGSPIGATYLISTQTSDFAGLENIHSAQLSDGRIFVSWSQPDAGGNTQIFANYLDATGGVDGTEFVVNSAPAGEDLYPTVAVTANDLIAVSWYGDGAHRVQLFDASGARVGTEKVISNAVALPWVMFATPTPDGGVFYSWRGLDGSGEGALGRLLNADGTFGSGDINLGPTTVGHQFGEESAVNSRGVLVALSADISGGVDGSGYGVFKQVFQLPTGSGNTLTEDTASTSGTLNFSDVDLNDVHSISGGAGVYTGTGTALGTLAASVTHDTTGTGTGGVVSWTYTLNTAAAQYLAAGVTKTETFDVVLSDGTTTVTKSITVTITGTNDGAAITANAGGDYAVTEAGGVGNAIAGDPSAQGQLTITDADSGQDHFQTPASLAATYGTFTFNAATGAWTYALNQTLANALAAGANVADTLTVTSFDGTATHNITVNITGGNDAPVITSSAHSQTLQETDAALTASGQVTFTDADFAGTPNAAVTARLVTASDVPLTPSQIAAFEAAFTITNAATGTWSFNLPANDAEFLDGDDTVQIVYTVTVTDDSGASAAQNVTITINGETDNQPPIVSATVTSAAFIDTPADDTFEAVTGMLSAADPDAGDSVTFSIEGGSPIAAPDFDQMLAGTYGTLYLNSASGAYSYEPLAAVIQGLKTNASETFTLAGTDLAGATGTQTLTITITGGNDTPDVASTLVAEAYSDTANDDTFAVLNGTVGGSDRDAGDTLSYGLNFGVATTLPGFTLETVGSYGTLYVNATTGAYRYVPNDAKMEGQTFNTGETFGLTAIDASGATSEMMILLINVDGAFDAPTLSASVTTTTFTDTSADNTFVPASGTLTVTDRDGTGLDSFTYGVSGSSASGLSGYNVQRAGTYGTLHVNASTGAYTYVPNDAAIEGRKTNASETFTLSVTDLGSNSATRTLTVNVTGANDTPENLNVSSGDVVENIPGALVGNLSVLDRDLGETTTYTIRPGLDGALFAISGNELRVGTAGLDFEASPTRTVTVRATDASGAFVERNFVVNVLDRTEVSLTTATDIYGASADNTQFLANPSTLNATDNLDGGTGADSLAIFGSGTFNLNNLAGYAGIEQVSLVNYTSSTASLTLRNGTAAAVSTSGTGSTNISASGTAAATTIQGGDASDGVSLSGSASLQSFSGGSGSDWLYIYANTAWNPNLVFDGGLSSDGLYFSVNSATIDLTQAALTRVEQFSLYGTNSTAIVDADVITGITYFDGQTGNKILTAEAALNLSGKSFYNITLHSTNAAGTSFTVNSAAMAGQIFGGTGNDTINAASLTFTVEQREAIFATASIETIVDATGTYTAPAPSPAVFKLTPGIDTVAGTAAAEVINASAVTLQAADSLAGGGGIDRLTFYGSGTFDLNTLAGYSSIEEVAIANSTDSSASLYLRNGTTTAVSASGTGRMNIGFSGTASGTTIQGSDGIDRVTLSGSGTIQSFSGGNGNDQLYFSSLTAWNPTVVYDGGLGTSDRLEISIYGATIDLTQATLSNVEQIWVYHNNATAIFDANTIASVTRLDGQSGARIETAEAAVDLSNKTIANLTVHSSNITGTTFTVNSAASAGQLFGGSGNDTINAAALTLTAAERDAIFATTSIETIVDATGTYTAPPPSATVFKLTPGTDTVSGTAADDTINARSATLQAGDSLAGGAGVDRLAIYGGGSFDLSALAAYSSIEQLALATISGYSTGVFLRDGTSSAILTSGTSSAIVYSAGTGSISNFQGSDGQDEVQLSSTGTIGSFMGGGGTDTLYVLSPAAWNPNLVYDGGTGTADRLYLGFNSATVDLTQATLSNVEQLYVSGGTAIFDADTISGIASIDGSAGGKLLTADTAVNLSGKSISGLTVHSTNATGTSFSVSNSATAFQIAGGTGTDTIIASGLTLSGAQRDAIFNGASIEVVRDNSGTYGNNAANALTALVTGGAMYGNGGGDTLTGGTGNDTLSGGAGIDTFVFAPLGGVDVVADFTSTDVLNLTAFGFADDAAALATATQSGADTLFTFGPGHTLRLLNFDKLLLSGDDILT